jgi:hypothetical protein
MVERVSFEGLYPKLEGEWLGSLDDFSTLPELGIDLETYAGQVKEGTIVDFNSPQYETIASDGFISCTGLIVHDLTDGKFVVGHLDQYGWTAGQYFNWIKLASKKDIVFIMGERSVAQRPLQELLREGFYGDATVRMVDVDSGKHPWGLVFSKKTGELTTLSRDPAKKLVYDLFRHEE